jgi:hypothetical protein
MKQFVPQLAVVWIFDGYQMVVKATIWNLGAIANWLFATE